MRFKKYINEAKTRSKVIEEYKAISLIKKNCSDILKIYQKDGFCMFRGIINKTDDFLYIDPTKSERKAKNIVNYYTLLIDNLPSWKDYPKRSRSLICATYREGALTYAPKDIIYVVFPYNGANIGICSTFDIWSSFSKSIHVGTNYFVEKLDLLFNEIGISNADKDWKTFTKSLDKLSEKLKTDNKIMNLLMKTMPFQFYDLLKAYNFDMFKTIEQSFDSNSNDFEHKKTSNFKYMSLRREIWIGEKPCILMKYDPALSYSEMHRMIEKFD